MWPDAGCSPPASLFAVSAAVCGLGGLVALGVPALRRAELP
ncbi:hypothetical protein [Streptomyces thermodiastaticus]|nr:hypothetical protein [Streptomyces thermodiastaticus]